MGIKFDGKILVFDRTSNCDWCGKRRKVAITRYGTTNYNRLVCEDCVAKIKIHDKLMGFDYDA